MALTLREAITANQTTFDVLGDDDLEPGDFKTIDSETIVIRTAKVATLGYSEPARYRVSAYRGANGSRAVAHDAAATLTAFSGGDGGGVTVDNTVDTPTLITNATAGAYTGVSSGYAVDTPTAMSTLNAQLGVSGYKAKMTFGNDTLDNWSDVDNQPLQVMAYDGLDYGGGNAANSLSVTVAYVIADVPA